MNFAFINDTAKWPVVYPFPSSLTLHNRMGEAWNQNAKRLLNSRCPNVNSKLTCLIDMRCFWKYWPKLYHVTSQSLGPEHTTCTLCTGHAVTQCEDSECLMSNSRLLHVMYFNTFTGPQSLQFLQKNNLAMENKTSNIVLQSFHRI